MSLYINVDYFISISVSVPVPISMYLCLYISMSLSLYICISISIHTRTCNGGLYLTLTYSNQVQEIEHLLYLYCSVSDPEHRGALKSKTCR